MPYAQALPFSFVRLEDLAASYCMEEADYVLPAGTVHEAKFQFLVNGFIDSDFDVELGINGTQFIPAKKAILLEYKYRLTLPFYTAGETFRLISFKLGDETITYNKLVTWEQFFQLLNDDFGITDATVDNNQYLVFSNKCLLDTELTAAELPANVPEIANTILYCWHKAYIEAPDVAVTEECFQYTLHGETETTDIILGVTNWFKKQNSCYTTLLKYWGNESSFGFTYAGEIVNQVRIPAYLSRPLHPQKRNVYIKSSGNQVLLSASIEKEYQLQTDWMIELFHECLTIALNHDNVVMKGDSFREKEVSVIASEYTAEWNQDHELIKAPGKGKVKMATFGKSNSNCGAEADSCTNETTSCPVVTGISISNITASTAIASWAAAGSPVVNCEISIFRADTPATPLTGYPLILDAGVTSHLFTGLEAETAYQFYVRSNCVFGVSDWGNMAADPDFETTA